MNEPSARTLTNTELVERLRRAAGIWFKNTDLLLLEELIKRFSRANHGQTNRLPRD